MDQFITVVSGLPRSGTSMLMQMLEKGGLPVLIDGFRKADDDNPHGYYEFEPVKQLSKDASWITEAYDKAVKVIYIFLYNLPLQHRYKVLFIRRDLDEVVASQKVMLRRRNEGDRMSDQQLASCYAEQLQALDLWLRSNRNFAVHYLEYRDVVSDPARAAREISAFLGLRMDLDAMVRAVDQSLHRNHSNAVGV